MALTHAFKEKVDAIEQRLKMEPGSLLSIISFETGGSFGADVKNRMGSGATGLIQFMPSTAAGLGTSTKALAQMSPEDQLDYVERYLAPYKGKIGTLKDAYMSVLYPKAIGKPEFYPLFTQGTTAYRQNAGLDRDKKGVVTVGDAVARVRGSSAPPPEPTVAQAPSREPGPQAPAFTAQESAPAETAALTPGGTDWASLLFSDASPALAQDSGRTGGTDWTQALFG